MTTAYDAETYRLVADALERHRDDIEGWRRVGGMLKAQRYLLDPEYKNRTLFVTEKGVDYKATADLERAGNGGRRNFTPETIIEFSETYGITPRSFARALDGGEFEQDAPKRRLRSVPAPAVPSVLQPDAKSTIREAKWLTPEVDRLYPDVEKLVVAARDAHPETALKGEWVFRGGDGEWIAPYGEADAARWDGWTALEPRWSLWKRTRMAAIRRVLDEAAASAEDDADEGSAVLVRVYGAGMRPSCLNVTVL